MDQHPLSRPLSRSRDHCCDPSTGSGVGGCRVLSAQVPHLDRQVVEAMANPGAFVVVEDGAIVPSLVMAPASTEVSDDQVAVDMAFLDTLLSLARRAIMPERQVPPIEMCMADLFAHIDDYRSRFPFVPDPRMGTMPSGEQWERLKGAAVERADMFYPKVLESSHKISPTLRSRLNDGSKFTLGSIRTAWAGCARARCRQSLGLD
mmetsp:Transcript_24070/g.60500  ORF Transcript_24070/g.60500 Transcript_24070/m.60500 type:complete len:205 (-) Transcript_24070:150-764(-)